MKVNIVSRKMIKPHTPTPQTLNKHKLSFLDEFQPSFYVSFVLFYLTSNDKDIRVNNLEESFAKTLTQFYTFAGRYNKNNSFVACNDFGAEYVEANAVQGLSDFIAELKTNHQQLITCLLPCNEVRLIDHDPLLAVQVTRFECGCVSIGVSVSHKIADIESITMFLASWGHENNPRSTPENIIGPNFNGPLLFPSKDNVARPNVELSHPLDNTNPKIAIKNFSFNNEVITGLKSMVSINRRASKVLVVSSLIAKALINVDHSKHRQKRNCLIIHAMNLRERTIPPLPKYSCGNFTTSAVTEITSNHKTGFEELVSLIGDSIHKRVKDCAEIFDDHGDYNHNILLDPIMKLISSFQTNHNGINLLAFTDWSKFGLYDIDLGWGKPTMTTFGTYHGENIVVLMGNKDGDGIEAWVQLNENDMLRFEQHIKDILECMHAKV